MYKTSTESAFASRGIVLSGACLGLASHMYYSDREQATVRMIADLIKGTRPVSIGGSSPLQCGYSRQPQLGLYRCGPALEAE